MTYQFRFLNQELFPEIHQCFMESFADYHLDMKYMSKENLYNRHIKNGIDFEKSVGVYVDNKMVGLTLVAVDEWKGNRAAFDTGTGLIKEHRGKGLAKQMFDFVLPKLKEDRLSVFVLEVLQVNEAGVKAYKKSGFSISREFDCFQLLPAQFKSPQKSPDNLVIKPVGKAELKEFEGLTDWVPSWENSFSSMQRIPDEFHVYGAYLQDQCAGILAYYPGLNWITCLMVKKEFRRMGIAGNLTAHLLKQLPKDTEIVKMVNVEHTDTGMVKLMEGMGFTNYVTQFEMELPITE